MISFDRLEIHEGEYWIWQVHENQSYLGRLILRLKRPVEHSCVYCTEAEWLALRLDLAKYEEFMSAYFAPDRFNYGQLGNIYPQLHFHAVPRYRNERRWCSHTFTDECWGKNWAPTPKSPMSLSETYEFAGWMRGELKIFFGVKAESTSAGLAR